MRDDSFDGASSFLDLVGRVIAGLGWSLLALGVLAIGVRVHHEQTCRLVHEAGEPPLVPYSMPVLANTVAYGKDVYAFFSDARKRFGPLKPFTCFVALQRFYVLSDPFHSYHVLRRPGTYSFIAVIVGMMKPLFGINKDGLDALNADLSDDGYAYSTARFTRDWIAQHTSDGSSLDQFEMEYLQHLERQLGELAPGNNLSLLSTVCQVICKSSVPLLHGEAGMHNDPTFVHDFYAWSDNVRSLMTGLPPRVFARTAYLARERCCRSIERVLAQPDRFDRVSGVIRARVAFAKAHGIALGTAAQIDMGVVVALLANSIPANFWMLVHACESADLREQLRAEIAAGIRRSATEEKEEEEKEEEEKEEEEEGEEGGRDVYTVSCSHLTTRCPLLRSLWDEVLRYYTNSAQLRLVTADGGIPADKCSDEELQLRKGGLIQIPLRVAHVEPTIWGADAHEFDPWSYRPFGSGLHLCPGRHFAVVEAFAFLATVLWFFDVDLHGRKVPGPQLGSVSLGIAHPVGDVFVTVARRKGMETARWVYGE